MKKSIYVLVLTLGLSFYALAQVGIGTNAPHASSILDVESIEKGFLPPRLASDGLVSDPAEGLIIYDESDDCLNLFNGDEWVNMCNSLGANTDALLGSGWGTSLKFDQVVAPRLRNNTAPMTFAVSKDGILYAWGQDNKGIAQNFDPTAGNTDITTSGTLNFLPSPWKLSDPNFDGQIKHISAFQQQVVVLKNNGELYTFGDNKYAFVQPSASTFNTYVKPRLVAPPLAGQTFVDVNVSNFRITAITNDGKAYFFGRDNPGATVSAWREIPAPSSTTAGFEYTEIMDRNNSESNNIVFKGNDGSIYIWGISETTSGLLGSNFSGASGLLTLLNANNAAKIDFPAGAGNIVKVNVSDRTAVAFDDQGNAYGWGFWKSNPNFHAFLVDPSASPVTTMTTAITSIVDPVLIALPPGETSFVSFAKQPSTTANGSFFVGASGKTYFIGNNAANSSSVSETNLLYELNTDDKYVLSGSASHLDVAEVYHDSGYVGLLDKSGVWHFFGDLNSIYVGGFQTLQVSTGTNTSQTNFKSPVALPLQDGNLDPLNLRP